MRLSQTLTFFLISAAFFLASTDISGKSSRPVLPGVILWAWERPENLDFIDPREAAVAFLAQSVELSGEQIKSHPRMQPLRVPPATTLIAVVRLSTDRLNRPSLSEQQVAAVISELLRVSRLPGVHGLQIDFDATVSERPFYRSLLVGLRPQLPDTISLSITALASWCLADTWIKDLPVDDAIPMLFRLGTDREAVLRALKEGRDFSLPRCRQSVGISVDEPFPTVPPGRRVYVFNPQSWTKERYQSVREELKR